MMAYKFAPYIFAFSGALLLSACVKPDIHFETQKVTIKTPGAKNAKCFLHNQEYRYVAYNNQTITITRTAKDIDVTCQAEGNREKTVTISPDTHKVGIEANKIPEVITVDFRGMPYKPYDLPKYHDKDIGKYPLPTEVEYMGPTSVVTDEEPFQETDALGKRVRKNVNPFSDGFTSKHDAYDPREEDK